MKGYTAYVAAYMYGVPGDGEEVCDAPTPGV